MGFAITLTASDPAATSIVLTDGSSPGKWGVDAWNPGSSVWDTQFGGPRGNLGALPSSMTPQNRVAQLGLSCWPTDLQDAATLRAQLGVVLDRIHRWGGRLTYQHTNQTHRQHLIVMAGGVETAAWTPRSERDGRHGVAVQLTCAPHVEGDPLGWTETWAAGVTDWEATTGDTADLTADEGGLRSSAAGVHRVIRVPAYDLQDVQAVVSYTPGQVASSRFGVVLHHYPNGDSLEVVAQDTGSTTELAVVQHDVSAGTTSVVGVTATATRVVAGQPSTILGRVHRGVVTAEWWANGAAADPWTTPTLALTYASSAAAIEAAGPGRAGVVWTRNHADDRVHDVRVHPSAVATTTGEGVTIRGVPGDVPAAVDLDVHLDPSTGGASGSQERFGLVALAPAQTRTLVTDGGFGLTATPKHWADTSYSGLLTSGKATLTRDTTVARTGYGSGKVVTTGSGQGVTHVIHHEFRVGQAYTASVWVRSTGAPALRLRIGVNGDIASSASTTATTGWQQLTVTWTPTTTTQLAYLVVEQTNSGALTWWVDDATCTHGATAKIRGGWGGHQCDGTLTAVDATDTDGTIHNTGAGAAYLHDKRLAWTSTTGGFATYMLDTSSLEPDDLGGAVMVEAWLQANLPNAVEGTYVASVRAPNDTNSDHRVYTLEHGSGGVVFTPGSPNGFHLVRLGTLPLIASSEPTELTVTHTYGSSQSWSWAHLILVPARLRACSPTGLPDLTGYPVFAATTDAIGSARRFTSDLQGWRREPGTDAWSPAPPLEGPVLEAAPGANRLMVTTAGNAPNSGAVHGSAEATRPIRLEPNITPRWRHLRDA